MNEIFLIPMNTEVLSDGDLKTWGMLGADAGFNLKE